MRTSIRLTRPTFEPPSPCIVPDHTNGWHCSPFWEEADTSGVKNGPRGDAKECKKFQNRNLLCGHTKRGNVSTSEVRVVAPEDGGAPHLRKVLVFDCHGLVQIIASWRPLLIEHKATERGSRETRNAERGDRNEASEAVSVG